MLANFNSFLRIDYVGCTAASVANNRIAVMQLLDYDGRAENLVALRGRGQGL